jgi:predicted neuraminidase
MNHMTRRSLIQATAAAACITAMPMIGVRATHVLAADAAPAQAGLVSSEFIFESAPFPSCHASTIVETKAGLVAAWFGGTRERAPDVGIWLSRHEDGKWLAPVEVVSSTQADGSRIPSWNPVLFQPTRGPLLLFYKVGPSPSTWWGMLKTSTDNGRAWSDAQRLPDGILGPIKNKPIELADGSLLCPSSSEGHPEEPKWRIHFERTADLGKTWTTSAPKTSAAGDTPINAIQPSILRHGGQQLQAIGRTRNGRLFETGSQDDGKTWTPLTLTALPNPNSGTDAVTLRDGRHLLIYNHNDRPKGRTPLNIAVSKDGKTWEAALVLESEPGEYSYPAIIQTSDGLVHATYTWKRQRIKHAVIDPAKLQAEPMAHGQWPDVTTTTTTK